MTGTVVAVCISSAKGVQKQEQAQVNLKAGWGIEGDAHAGRWHRQVSLLAQESTEKMQSSGFNAEPGCFAENITTRGIDLVSLPEGTRLKIGAVLLEVTQIGKTCHHDCAIYRAAGDCVMPREGIFTRVLQGGQIRRQDLIEVIAEKNPSAETG